MKTKIQIKSIFGSILFELEKEDNSIKDTLIEAVKSGADLSGAYLSRADLSRADLSRANLSRADLSGADLSGANLSGANLSGAYLFGADLSRANLSRADLSGVDLSRANLSRANLSRANLSGVDLSRANLSRANLSRANLSGANLSGAYLFGANGLELDKIKKFFWITPEEGAFTAWKKCGNGCVVKLEIPAEAKRTSNIKNRKCRAEFVKVLEVFDNKGESISSAFGMRDAILEYKTGELVRPDSYDDDFREDCSHGIHFFMTRQEAEEWES